MRGLVFVDTNVLLYSLDAGVPEKQRVARGWREALWRRRRGRISYQVLHEFYVQGCRLSPRAKEKVRAEVNDLLAWDPVVLDQSVLLGAFAVQDDFGLSFWDSLIVAAAQVGGCEYLLTEDLQHGQDLHGLHVVNPFKAGPDDLDARGAG